jgi:hypothetical protein
MIAKGSKGPVMSTYLSGGCLCQRVRYQANEGISQITACHCSQCQRQTSHSYVSMDVKIDHFEITDKASLKWFKSSDHAERGFCQECGSVLFWKRFDSDMISLSVGSLDQHANLKISRHIHVDGAING